MPRKILVTAALPYANGPIHLGHLVEYIQTDIWVRFQKLRGNRCVFVCADDTHGTAIMIRARQEGRSEEAVIAETSVAHQRDFASFDIAFDNYGSTNSESNRKLCAEIWTALRGKGLIAERDVSQLYDPVAGTFLADRFVKGTCPICKTPDQYGDNCEKCSSTYSPTDLIDPVSTLSGAKPEVRSAKHLFVELEKLHAFLQEWTQSGHHLQTEVANYLKGHFLGEPLRDWDVSRPAPYFGFEIPDSPGNYWYVWFDAPIGYVASTTDWCERTGEKLENWWKSPDVEIHHFIGKDITYFHTLFWPGMLKSAEFSLPEKIHIHGFLTVNGKKMSKRDGTFVKAETYAKHLDPSLLRHYYASKLGPRLDDIDMNLDEFIDKVNSDLVGKVVNIASRCAKFASQSGLSPAYPSALDEGLFAQAAKQGEEIAAAYESCDYAAAIRTIMLQADRANQFIDKHAPWKLAKDPAQADKLRDICTIGLNLFRQLMVYLAPVLPRQVKLADELLTHPIASWDDAKSPLVGIQIATFQHMLKRVERKDVDAMIEDSREAAPETVAPAVPQHADTDDALKAEPLSPEITIDDFAKVDLRVARVIAAEHVPEARKLLKLTLSLGGENQRTVFAGIKAAYEPEKLVGRLVVMVANLAPRQMKFGLSEGMVTAVGGGGEEVFLLALDEGAKPGMRVH
jgi:methionyl-tRNA synthetase